MAKYHVSREEALNFVHTKRPIATTQHIPEYWNFLGASPSFLPGLPSSCEQVGGWELIALDLPVVSLW